MKYLLLLIACCVLSISSSTAQKFGYVNSNELLALMPDVAAADAALDAYQTELVAPGQARVKQFENDYKKYLNEVNEGILSKVQMQARETQLGTEQQAIGQFEQEVKLKVLQKREELLSPILAKLDEAIQAVGKEQGYTMIFDSGTSGAMLYAPEDDNILELIKAKLGVQ